MNKLLICVATSLMFSAFIHAESTPTKHLSETNDVLVAEKFVDAFYSFKAHALTAILSSAEESIPSIVYYQGWAEGGNYQIISRAPCKEEKPSLISCSITVQDDLMLALGIDFNVTDTFHLSFNNSHISSVATSSNDLQVFRDAQEWVTNNLPELIKKPCRDFFNGGPTPGLCVKAMVQGYAKFAENYLAMQIRIDHQIQASDRHEFDLPKDEFRKPFEVFQFLGLEAGMVCMDVAAYAGYTSELLGAAVGVNGKVYSQNRERVLLNYAEGYYKLTMDERLANNRLPNVELHLAEYDALGLEGQLDFAFLGNILHDFYYRDGEANALLYLRSIAKALKPGGVLGITDHIGLPGQDNGDLHRIDLDTARALIQDAGLIIEAESALLANPEDHHGSHVYSDAIYRRTDRFAFRVRKPR
jgi:predicted methyltransferase